MFSETPWPESRRQAAPLGFEGVLILFCRPRHHGEPNFFTEGWGLLEP